MLMKLKKAGIGLDAVGMMDLIAWFTSIGVTALNKCLPANLKGHSWLMNFDNSTVITIAVIALAVGSVLLYIANKKMKKVV